MEIEVTPEEGFLRIQVTGQLAMPDANNAFVRVLEAVAAERSRRVLVDCSGLEGSLSVVERYQHSKFGSEQLHAFWSRGVAPNLRFAYVAKSPIADPWSFGETVAVNRGVNVRLFESTSEALQWLEEGADRKPGESATG